MDSHISHDKLILVNNVLQDYDNIKKLIKNRKIKIKILISEKELTDPNYERLKKAMSNIENNLIDIDYGGNMYLTVDSLIDINNIIFGSNKVV